MDSHLMNCFVCLNANNLHKFGVFGKRKKVTKLIRPDIDDIRCVDNQVQVIFLLKKMLEIPDGLCIKFFQEYGNPCSWIYCCNSCSVLVDNARSVFDEMTVLQRRFEKLQMDLKNAIVESVKTQATTFYNDPQNGPNMIVRSYVSKGLNPLNEARIKVEAEEDFDADDEDGKLDFNYLDWSPVDTSDDDNDDDDEDFVPPSSIHSNRQETNDTKEDTHLNDNSEVGVSNNNGKKYSCDICSKDFNEQSGLIKHRLAHSGIKRLYECDVCQKRFTQSGSLKIHYRIHTGESSFVPQIFNCDFCNRKYTNYDTFICHLKTHANDLYKCEVCGEEFNEPQLYVEHSKKIHDKEIIMHWCTICNNVFPDPTALNVHMKCHSAENAFSCDVCTAKFTNTRDFHNHLRTHSESTIEPYKCQVCGQTFKQPNLLTFHLKREHDGEITMYPCKICGKKFVKKTKLRRHMEIHSDHRPFHCEICRKNFRNANSFKSHQKTHNAETQIQFNCDFCGETCKSLGILNTHIAKVHPSSTPTNPGYVEPRKEEKPFLCLCCGNKYQEEEQLVEHVKSHLEEHPNMCDKCGKHFLQPHTLKIHYRDHTGERPYQCNFCEKSFKQSVSLILHRRTHTGEKPYKCDICEKAFTQSSHLYRHKNTHLNKDQAS